MDEKSGGFTLVELILVIAILGIITAIAVPRIAGLISMSEESVCAANIKTFERMYATFLVGNDIEHEDSLFDQFIIENLDEVCPAGGVIRYEDGKMTCSIHEDESKDDEVPWL